MYFYLLLSIDIKDYRDTINCVNVFTFYCVVYVGSDD